LSGETPGGSRAAAGKDPLGDDGLTPFFDPSKNTFFDLPFLMVCRKNAQKRAVWAPPAARELDASHATSML
jgi:hypothetical protein